MDSGNRGIYFIKYLHNINIIMYFNNKSSHVLESSSGIEYRQDNTIIFSIGRMNPPTPGHLELIRNLIMEGILKGVSRVFVILSNKNDNNNDPLPCYKKKFFLNTMIEKLKTIMMSKTIDESTRNKIQDMKVEIMCVPDVKDATAFTTIINFIDSPAFKTIPDINLFLIFGEDRIENADIITDITSTIPNVYSVDYKLISRKNMENIKQISENSEELCKMNMKMISPTALSASFVKNVVKYCHPEKLIEIYHRYLNENLIRELYDDVYNGVTNLPTKVTNEYVVNQTKYDYPQIKGKENYQKKQNFLFLILFLFLFLFLILLFMKIKYNSINGFRK
jgi:hypothetical protein